MRERLAFLGEEVEDAKLPYGLEWVWTAWQRLDLDRPWRAGGMGPPIPGPIPLRDVREWCEFHDLAGEDVLFLDTCFAEMDKAYMDWHAEQVRLANIATGGK